jgi:hypothetical protein
MLAIVGGSLALVGGLALLFLPLLASELSRPRDSVWGALVLLLGLVLVTSAERISGAPMLAVLCGGLLVGRLGTEVGQARWRMLSPEERQQLASAERWARSLRQLGASVLSLLQFVRQAAGGMREWLAERRRSGTVTKRWVRPSAEQGSGGAAGGSGPEAEADEGEASSDGEAAGDGGSEDGCGEGEGDGLGPSSGEEAASGEAVVVESFDAIEVMLRAGDPAPQPQPETEPAVAADQDDDTAADNSEADGATRSSD